MNTRRSFAVAAVMVCVLGACTTVPPEQDPVLIKLTQLEDRLARVERVIENQSLVSLVTELEQVRTELAGLRDQVETLSFEADNANKRQRDQYVDIDTRLNSLETGMATAVGGPLLIESAEGEPGAAAGGAVDDRDAYQQAFGLLEEGRYGEASEAFDLFVQTYPDSALVDNAQYWLAESLYVEREFQRALDEFNRVVEVYPQSRKVPDAWLKIGYTHYEMKQWADARTALERVVSEHSGSTAARLAGQRLERMTTEGR